MKIFFTTISKLLRNPGKSILTIATVGLGIAVLILALSMSGFFNRAVDNVLRRNGMIVAVSNGTVNSDGEYEQARPSEFDENIEISLMHDVPDVEAAAPLSDIMWQNVQVDDKIYAVRRMAASNDMYLDVFNLELVAGTDFTENDIEEGNSYILLTKSLSELWFGSAEDAIGKTITPSMGNIFGGRGQGREGRSSDQRFTIPEFKVIGVYQDPPETTRQAYRIVDLLIPYTSFMPDNEARNFMSAFVYSSLYVRMDTDSIDKAESLIRTAAVNLYGDDVQVTVWEGAPGNPSEVIKDVRESISMFSVLTNILGFILLFSGSIGILSIMLVDVLGRSREIALERALGASKAIILREYMVRSLVISGFSFVFGLILSLVLGSPILKIILPVFSVFPVDLAGSGLVSIEAVGIALAAALLTGAILGMLPVRSALKTEIVEGIRDV